MPLGTYFCDLGDASPGRGFFFDIPAGLLENDDRVCTSRDIVRNNAHTSVQIEAHSDICTVANKIS